MVGMNSRAENEPNQKNALIISATRFGGFHRDNNRLQLGWFVLSTVPYDIEDQLKRAVEEVGALKAEIDRVKAEAKAKVEQAEQEHGVLKDRVSRLAAENEHLKALVERVSSGVR